jgi:Rod binding domain-containing protein
MIDFPSAPRPVGPQAPKSAQDTALWAKAQALEAAFLSEMLGLAGIGQTSKEFGGGIGEDQFASFLRQEQAKAIVNKGGIGLAESLFKSLAGRSHDDR